MYELTLQQTETVSAYVKRQQVVYAHLCDDLIDHLCCDLEESVRNGIEFNEAFRQLKRRIGKGGIKKIQEDTLYAVDYKYRKMKNLMKVAGVAGTVFLGFSTIFKLQHYPLSGALLVVGAIILVTLFLPASLMVLWKESKSGRNIFMFVTAFLASTLFIAGILFKVQHWTGGSMLLAVGLLIALIILLPVSMVRALRNPDKILPSRVIVSGTITIMLYGSGFLLKILHWPGATILLSVSIILLVSFIIPATFYYRWKDDDHVAPEALFLIFTVVMFIVPATIINLNANRNFDNLFIKTSSLNDRNIELRLLRNNLLVSNAGLSDYQGLTDLESAKAKVISSINRIENIVAPSYNKLKKQYFTDRTNNQDDLFNYHNTEMVLEPGSDILATLERNLSEYAGMVGIMNAEFQEQYNTKLLALETYLPVTPGTDESRYSFSPVAMVQCLEVLKGAVLDAEALTIRNIKLKSAK